MEPPLSRVLYSSTLALPDHSRRSNSSKFGKLSRGSPSKPASMPPKEEKPQVVACFAPGKGQLGSVGMGFMEAYAELSESIIDVDSGEKMEAYLDKKQLVNGVQRLRRRQNAPPHVLPHVPPRTRRRTPQALLLSAADALNDDTALLLSHACPMSLDIVPWSFTRRRH